MSPLILCLTAVGGLFAGFVLAQLIRVLPAILFPELRAARARVDSAATREQTGEKGCTSAWRGEPPPGAARERAQGKRPSWCRICVRVAPTVGVMLLTTMMLFWTISRVGFTWHGAVYAAWLSGLLVLAGIDLRYFLLPDVLTVGLLGLALLANVAGFGNVSWISALFGAILGYAVLWSLNALYRRFRGFDGFGGGDLKMMAALGGWFGASGVVDVLMVASVLALVPAAIVRGLGAQRVSLQTAIPFGPFLAIAAAGLTITRIEGGIGSFMALS